MPRCPKCKCQADLIKYEGIPVHNCGSCGGHWVTEPRFDAILARREVVMPEPVREAISRMAAAHEAKEALWCMSCGKRMTRTPFKFWADIQIDRCPGCGGIWLDRGELEKCQIYWEAMQDDPDSDEARKAERMAELEAAWQGRKGELEERIEHASQVRDYRMGPGWLRNFFNFMP